MTKYSLIERCIVDGKELIEIVDLGVHPFADTFIPKERFYESEPIFPLKCGLCTECGLVQLLCLTNPRSRYGMYDYSYTSSNSEFAKQHWMKFAQDTIYIHGSKLKVLEIGSNDGFLLEQYRAKGWEVIGIDSSEAMARIANEAGIPTLHEIFDQKVAEKLAKTNANFDLIVANNVLNHSNDPLDFLKGVEKLLSNQGKFVFEVPYWLSSVQTVSFDQIYHEHISYFTIASLMKITDQTGMSFVDISVNDYHGGSLRITLSKGVSVIKKDWTELIKIEENANLSSIETYKTFMQKVHQKRIRVLAGLYQILASEPNAKIVLAGAAAKANTFINYYKLDSTIIECITDNSSHKIGKYTPLSRIPILPDSSVAEFKNLYVLVTAWNIKETIMNRILLFNPNGKVLNYEEN